MSGNASELSARELHFSKFILGGLVLVATGLSLGEQDRRSLFLSDLPEAFAVSDLGDNGPANFPIFIGPRNGAPLQRTVLRRGGAAPGFVAPTGPVASGGGGGSPAAPVQIAQAGAVPFTVPAAAAPGGAPSGFGGIPPLGSGSSPIAGIVPAATTPTNPTTPTTPTTPVPPGSGVDPVTPAPGVDPVTPAPGVDPVTPAPGVDPVTPAPGVDPVVPAVPEPASWLMMLIGVGVLGAVLRRRHRHEAAVATAG